MPSWPGLNAELHAFLSAGTVAEHLLSSIGSIWQASYVAERLLSGQSSSALFLPKRFIRSAVLRTILNSAPASEIGKDDRQEALRIRQGFRYDRESCVVRPTVLKANSEASANAEVTSDLAKAKLIGHTVTS